MPSRLRGNQEKDRIRKLVDEIDKIGKESGVLESWISCWKNAKGKSGSRDTVLRSEMMKILPRPPARSTIVSWRVKHGLVIFTTEGKQEMDMPSIESIKRAAYKYHGSMRKSQLETKKIIIYCLAMCDYKREDIIREMKCSNCDVEYLLREFSSKSTSIDDLKSILCMARSESENA
jgi:hypothetical protein